MKKSTNNYERPEVQVVYVETEAGFARRYLYLSL